MRHVLAIVLSLVVGFMVGEALNRPFASAAIRYKPTLVELDAAIEGTDRQEVSRHLSIASESFPRGNSSANDWHRLQLGIIAARVSKIEGESAEDQAVQLMASQLEVLGIRDYVHDIVFPPKFTSPAIPLGITSAFCTWVVCFVFWTSKEKTSRN